MRCTCSARRSRTTSRRRPSRWPAICNKHQTLWRGSLLPLGCEASPFLGAASRPSGSKLPRHKSSSATTSLEF
ncbi:hypothetical protein CD175_08860 [Pseudomonas laurylsulfatiphila]|uniref:Uncharacterized protein n=1 Tax=Pseudomonas laurylsulfatiphila TaxID=2011015 RepID=A0A2S6FQA6_9PSED|nr:hypothetical protein CD175_08860 [Pseudomonas laurylsulfatiphila]